MSCCEKNGKIVEMMSKCWKMSEVEPSTGTRFLLDLAGEVLEIASATHENTPSLSKDQAIELVGNCLFGNELLGDEGLI